MSEEPEYPNEVQRFYYDTLKWCGCGNPEDALTFMRDVLEIMHLRSEENMTEAIFDRQGDAPWTKRTQELDALLGGGALGLSYLYVLDSFGLTEHGGSIGGSWLTPEGERILTLLKSRDLEEAMSDD